MSFVSAYFTREYEDYWWVTVHLVKSNILSTFLFHSTKGLDNVMLENTKKFDANTVDLLKCFLNQLNKPICLVAHNGNKFDFPLLKNQLRSLVRILQQVMDFEDSDIFQFSELLIGWRSHLCRFFIVIQRIWEQSNVWYGQRCLFGDRYKSAPECEWENTKKTTTNIRSEGCETECGSKFIPCWCCIFCHRKEKTWATNFVHINRYFWEIP